jgi:Mce-associated membrane protein
VSPVSTEQARHLERVVGDREEAEAYHADLPSDDPAPGATEDSAKGSEGGGAEHTTGDEPDASEIDSATAKSARRGLRRNLGASRRRGIQRALVFVVLPLLALAAAGAAAYFRWYADTTRASQAAGTEAVQAARDSTVAMLAYQPDTVGQKLHAAADRLTGSFRADYENLVDDVVIPGARDKKVTTLVSVPTASLVTSSPSHAVVLVFVNQNVTVGSDPPTDNATAVKVTLDKLGQRWLVSGFEPI